MTIQIKLIVAGLIFTALSFFAWHEISSYGESMFDKGYSSATEKQKEIDLAESERRYNERKKIQSDAQKQIESAKADAARAAAAVVGMRTETDRVRKLAEQYTGSQPASVPTRKVVSMLADMLDESNEYYQRAAEEADRYYNAGITCQNQYQSLIK